MGHIVEQWATGQRASTCHREGHTGLSAETICFGHLMTSYNKQEWVFKDEVYHLHDHFEKSTVQWVFLTDLHLKKQYLCLVSSKMGKEIRGFTGGLEAEQNLKASI